MEPVLIGYFPKRIAARPVGLESPEIEWICSVSECISAGPDGWLDAWRHNELWAFNSEDLAWSVVPNGLANRDFTLLAYRLLPQMFCNGEPKILELPQLAVQPLPSGYQRLGWDVVAHSGGGAFECSPLSCNYAANEFPVNRYCLVEELEDIIALACRFSMPEEHYEPGPYNVYEVWARELPVHRG